MCRSLTWDGNHLVIKDSNEVEVPAILEALRICLHCFVFFSRLTGESSSSIVISWTTSLDGGPWKFHLYFKEIKFLSLSIRWFFSVLANGMYRH